MASDFFKRLSIFLVNDTMTFTITEKDGKFTASVISSIAKDKKIQPLNIGPGTPEQFDTDFMDSLFTVHTELSPFLSNMKAVRDQTEKVGSKTTTASKPSTTAKKEEPKKEPKKVQEGLSFDEDDV